MNRTFAQCTWLGLGLTVLLVVAGCSTPTPTPTGYLSDATIVVASDINGVKVEVISKESSESITTKAGKDIDIVVRPNTYAIRLSRKYYKSQLEKVKLSPGQTHSVNVRDADWQGWGYLKASYLGGDSSAVSLAVSNGPSYKIPEGEAVNIKLKLGDYTCILNAPYKKRVDISFAIDHNNHVVTMDITNNLAYSDLYIKSPLPVVQHHAYAKLTIISTALRSFELRVKPHPDQEYARRPSRDEIAVAANELMGDAISSLAPTNDAATAAALNMTAEAVTQNIPVKILGQMGASFVYAMLVPDIDGYTLTNLLENTTHSVPCTFVLPSGKYELDVSGMTKNVKFGSEEHWVWNLDDKTIVKVPDDPVLLRDLNQITKTKDVEEGSGGILKTLFGSKKE